MAYAIEAIRTHLTRVIIAICALTTLISYLFVAQPATDVFTELQKQNTNIGTFALFTGFIVIIMRFVQKIMKKEEDWQFCIYAFAIMALWIPLGVYVGQSSAEYVKAFYSTKVALHAAAIGLLIFFNLSAVYRVFRMKDFRTAILPITAAILVATNSPWAQSLFPGINAAGMWLIDNLQMPGARTITIVAAIGGLALGVRILLGLERGALRAVKPVESTGGEN